MALPTGTITMSDVNVELGKAPTALISLNDADVRSLAERPTGTISMDDLRGKSAGPRPIAYAWGRNTNGRLGDNTIIHRSSPVTVIGGIDDWQQVSAGGAFSHGISEGLSIFGTRAWGANASGQLGSGDNISTSSPVIGFFFASFPVQVSAGSFHALAVTSNGQARSTGINSNGQLGDGTRTLRVSPVTVAGGITNWRQVSAGETHSAAIRDNGVAYTWGNNLNGRLGTNNTINRSSPVIVAGGITNWRQISAGSSTTHAVRENGVAYGWGNNSSIAVGDGTFVDRSSPVIVAGGITNWRQISSGNAHAVAVRENGVAYAWGAGLGLGSSGGAAFSPRIIAGGITNWKEVHASPGQSSAGVTESGIAYAWGNNSFGQVGDGTTTNRTTPTVVAGGITAWESISVGSQHTLAIADI